MCRSCDRDPASGRFTGRGTLRARREVRERARYYRTRRLWALTGLFIAIGAGLFVLLARAPDPCEVLPETYEPAHCARDHWAN
jgi:hypothetical protein